MLSVAKNQRIFASIEQSSPSGFLAALRMTPIAANYLKAAYATFAGFDVTFMNDWRQLASINPHTFRAAARSSS